MSGDIGRPWAKLWCPAGPSSSWGTDKTGELTVAECLERDQELAHLADSWAHCSKALNLSEQVWIYRQLTYHIPLCSPKVGHAGPLFAHCIYTCPVQVHTGMAWVLWTKPVFAVRVFRGCWAVALSRKPSVHVLHVLINSSRAAKAASYSKSSERVLLILQIKFKEKENYFPLLPRYLKPADLNSMPQPSVIS